MGGQINLVDASHIKWAMEAAIRYRQAVVPINFGADHVNRMLFSTPSWKRMKAIEQEHGGLMYLKANHMMTHSSAFDATYADQGIPIRFSTPYSTSRDHPLVSCGRVNTGILTSENSTLIAINGVRRFQPEKFTQKDLAYVRPDQIQRDNPVWEHVSQWAKVHTRVGVENQAAWDLTMHAVAACTTYKQLAKLCPELTHTLKLTLKLNAKHGGVRHGSGSRILNQLEAAGVGKGARMSGMPEHRLKAIEELRPLAKAALGEIDVLVSTALQGIGTHLGQMGTGLGPKDLLPYETGAVVCFEGKTW